MIHVRLTLEMGPSAASFHPMIAVMSGADAVERAQAIHWDFTGSDLFVVHAIEGDVDAFRSILETTPEVRAFEFVRRTDRSCYVAIRDATTDSLRDALSQYAEAPVSVVPPLVYGDGTLTYSLLGARGAIDPLLEAAQDAFDVTVETIGGLATLPALAGSGLSPRQREALETALELGYYDVPRSASHDQVADRLGCAPSTAAEHLRKAEATVIRAACRQAVY